MVTALLIALFIISIVSEKSVLDDIDWDNNETKI